MVVDQSDNYPEGRLLAGVLLGGLLALAVTDRWFADSLWIFLPLAAAFSLCIGGVMGHLPAIRRLFVHRARMQARVRERALQAFYQHGLYRTREGTGVLVFISLLERLVWILADQGIYAKISQDTLQEHANGIARGVKEGHAAEALCQEIGRVGEVLAQHFPARPDDVNELSDRVIIG